jgi:hypothetical protein
LGIHEPEEAKKRFEAILQFDSNNKAARRQSGGDLQLPDSRTTRKGQEIALKHFQPDGRKMIDR